MRFIETSIFTRVIGGLLDDEGFRALQLALLLAPRAGSVIPGSGGLRKMRWASGGGGKRGGCRVIYHWHEPSETYYLLYAYRKNEQEDLTGEQIQALGRIVREEFR
ncbi:Toxin HigB-2 [Aquisphaera giovannonii]|uniref:Toxin HigB-2 n=1 Tax=Aquisphaera giovannonii TaxID=406548 RepID=A0A5B9WC65_9BACT|nr:hypothetical protein [Aquisphaera giovannonii]QEH38117.1 Toxin HigB-2 [Aquisphaera giovannonii]